MRMPLFVTALVTACALPSPAVAQEKGKVGVTMGFPASVGVLWHVSDSLAVRPELSFSFGSAEDGNSESDATSFTTGVSLLFYLSKSDDLATYVSPRYAFTHARTESTFNVPPFGSGERESTTRGHLLSGSFGAQYLLGTRFSVFGELGLAYQRSTVDLNLLSTNVEPTSTTISTRSSVGVVLYF